MLKRYRRYITVDVLDINMSRSRSDFDQNVKVSEEIFRGGATIISPSRQIVETKNTILIHIL